MSNQPTRMSHSRSQLFLCMAAILTPWITAQTIDCDMDVMFMTDFTGSMVGQRYTDTLDTMQMFVEESVVTASNVQFGLMYFGTGVGEVHLTASLDTTRNQGQVLNEIDLLRALTPGYDGPTTALAIQAMRDDMANNARQQNADFAVIFLDSFSDGSSETIDQANLARAEGITVLAIGLGTDVPASHLDDISGGGVNTMWIVNPGDVALAVNQMRDIMCQVPTASPAPMISNGTDLVCDADVLFIIDYTGTMQNKINTIITVLRDVVMRSAITSNNLQYGFMIIGNQVSEIQVILPLDASITTGLAEVLDALDTLESTVPSWDGPRFDFALTEAIAQLNKSRGGATNRNVMVFITDSPVGFLDQVGELSNQARSEGTDIIALGIGEDTLEQELLILSGLIANTFMIDDVSELPAIEQEVMDRVCPIGSTPVCQFLDVAFVLDASGSISGSASWDQVIEFTKNFVRNFRVGPEFLNFGVIYFKTEAELLFNVSQFETKDAILDKIDELNDVEDGGDTNIAAALRLLRTDMYTNVDRSAPRVSLLITDGQSKVERAQTPIEAKMVRDSGIEIFAVGVGDDIDENELRNITNDPERFTRIENFDELLEILDPLIRDVCPNCTNPGDWVIIMDSSGSVGETSFLEEKEFVERLVENIPIDEGDARLGLMRFGDNGDIQWHLNEYSDTSDILLALTRVKYTGGKTNTGDALMRARTEMFTEANGDRPDEKNVIILFTDGGSNIGPPVLEQARLARLANITILVVAVTDWVNWVEINEIASDPDDQNTFSVESFTTMFEQAFEGVRRAACNDDDNCIQSPCQNGGMCTDEINNYYCTCPSGFAGENCQYSCPNPSDVAFVIDASGSINQDDYYSLQHCYKQLARALNIDTDHRVGLVNFNDNVFSRYGLTSYSTSKEVVDATSYLWMGGSTDTGEALRITRVDTLASPRPSSQKIAAFASDGHSTDRLSAFQEAARAHEDDITILSVGVDIKGAYSDLELDGLTSDPNGPHRWLHDVDCSYVDDMVSQMCNAENNCIPNNCVNGGSCIDHINSYECFCPQDASGVHCELACDGVLDVAFLVDISGSIREERFRDNVIPFMASIVDRLEVRESKTQVGLVTFDYDMATNSDRSAVQFRIGEFKRKEDIKHALRRLPYHGGRTNTADGLLLTRTDLFAGPENRAGAMDILFVVTDGESNVRHDSTIPEAVLAREAGIHVVVVSVENSVDNLELKGMASRPYSMNMMNANRYSDLPTVIDSVITASCDRADDCPDINACSGFGTCVDLQHRYWCNCFSTRAGPDCENTCSTNGDIGFLVDASGSVGEFDLAQDLMYAIAERLNFQNNGMRVGVVLYQTSATMEVSLNKHTDLMSFLNNLGFNRDTSVIGTNTASALRLMQNIFYTIGNGDRNGEPNTVVAITDGRSNVERASTIPEANNLRSSGEGVRIIAVGIGGDVDTVEIEGLADNPASENVFYVADSSAIMDVAEEIASILCSI